MRFLKMQGTGNDFVLFSDPDGEIDLDAGASFTDLPRPMLRELLTELSGLAAVGVNLLDIEHHARKRIEERELGLPAAPTTVHKGIRVFARVPETDEEVQRRRELTLPDYYEVAHLLVRRRTVTTADLHLLD